MLTYGHARILLGGDLNCPSENFLLEHYTGIPAPPADANTEKRMVEAARPDRLAG